MRPGLIGTLAIPLILVACEKAPQVATPTGEAVTVGQPTPPPSAPAQPLPPPVPAGAQLPPGHPPIGGAPAGHPPVPGAAGPGMRPANPMGDIAAEQGVEMPLVLEGSGSVAELRSRLAKVADASLHPQFEEAFRKVFTVQRQSRDNARASAILEPLAASPDKAVAALAERTLGYVRINSGFDAEGAKVRYLKAIELDPEYGEAHYALAFTLAISDLGKGKEHFDKAIALGVPDTRGLRAQFYK
jgi:hypothetical protein